MKRVQEPTYVLADDEVAAFVVRDDGTVVKIGRGTLRASASRHMALELVRMAGELVGKAETRTIAEAEAL